MKPLRRAFQWDLGRQIERTDFLLRWIPRYADWGFEELYLYLEDAFDFPSTPGIGRHRALSPTQMEVLTRRAADCGIRVVPIVPLLGHTAYLLKVEKLRYLSELRDPAGKPLAAGQICPLHEGTLNLARKLLRDVRPYCTGGIVHVGLDESFDLGKCPRCRKEVADIGLARHFANHATRLRHICHGLGLRMGMWADMLYYVPEAIRMLPKDVIGFDWFYYPFKKLPRVELYNFAEVDLTGALRKAGLEVYGCPNNGPFFYEPLTPFLDRLRNILSWWDYCHRRDAQGMLITSWSPVRFAIELNFCVDAAAASLWLNPGERDPRRMLELGFERVFGKKGRRFAALAAAPEKYQFTGYYRWQANRNWPGLATFESPTPWQREEAYFAALAKRAVAAKAPVPLRESLVFRYYTAQKDRFIREGSLLLAQARTAARRDKPKEFRARLERLQLHTQCFERAMGGALRATRILWRRSRFADDPNPNEQMLQDERKRLHELKQFVGTALQNPEHIWHASPLLGRWHLLVRVRNFAPALQGTAVEIQKPDGTWQTIHSLYALEFTADAGQPRADFRRRHSVAVDWDGRTPLKLRLAVRGLGQLEFHDLQLSNGVNTLRPSRIERGGGPVKRLAALTRPDLPGALLGVPAPRRGFPAGLDWTANQAWVNVEFQGD